MAAMPSWHPIAAMGCSYDLLASRARKPADSRAMHTAR